MARNITEVRLLSVPLESDYKHTLYFSSKPAQTEYFKGKTKHWGDDFSYQRKEKILRYPKDYDELIGCNYIMYKNTYYSDKWFYAFITKMEFVSEGVTFIHFETDVIQTWLFDYEVKPSFIERQHVIDDTIGEHTVPEQLETGPYKSNFRNVHEGLLQKTIILGSTVDLNYGEYWNVTGTTYNGLFSGIKYYCGNAEDIESMITELADEGKSDAITSIFTAPRLFIDYEKPENCQYFEVKQGVEVDKGSWMGVLDEEPILKPKDIDGYTPRNNKLFTYPYCYLNMSNNAGGNAIYRYEFFKPLDEQVELGVEDWCNFRIYAAVTPGMSIRIIPLNYNGAERNYDEGLNLGKFPVCAWNTDVYTNWLTQNSINIMASAVGGIAQTGIGVATSLTGAGALVGGSMVAGGVSQVLGTVGEIYAHSKVPPQVEGNVNSGDVTFSANYLTFTAYRMTIRQEYARIIDDYFDMFGYKINRVFTPNTNHRENWWYTKLIDANIDGAVPMEDMSKIKDCYNNGITFWRNPANIGNYKVSNNVI